MRINILTESEIRKYIKMDQEAIAVVEEGFTYLANGNVVLPPIMRIDVKEHNGEVDIKSAYIQGFDSFAIKISSGFFNNSRLGLPSGSGMMILVSAKTGVPEAILLDNGYLTNVRTGASGAVAAKFLARKQIKTAGIIGSGTQARFQMIALKLVRDYQRLLIYGNVPKEVDRYIAEMTPILGVEIEKTENPEAVVRQSDIVVSTTPSKVPFIKEEWLHPGLHITAMGADAEDKNEVCAGVLGQVDLLVCDRKSQCVRLGELHHGIEAGVISRDDDIFELGQLTSGQKSGRSSDQQVTFCDLTGVGVQDTAIALLAYKKAAELGLGVRIEV
jgi:ectoine utilization protein EutC